MADIPARAHNRNYENIDVPNNVVVYVYLFHYPNIRIHNRHFARFYTIRLRKVYAVLCWLIPQLLSMNRFVLPSYAHGCHSSYDSLLQL
jgi:hypothetical protein